MKQKTKKNQQRRKKKKKNRSKGKARLEGEHERLDSRQENEEQYDGMYTERRQK